MRPRTPVIFVIIMIPILAQANPLEMNKVVACEWWAHRRKQSEKWLSGAHPLHYDTDERTFDKSDGQVLQHPVFSSILYLEGNAGPTLITDKTPEKEGKNTKLKSILLNIQQSEPNLCLLETGLGTQGLLAWPSPNRLVSFPGNLLHGVLPARGSKTCTQASETRISFIAGWWDMAGEPRLDNVGKAPCQKAPTQTHVGQRSRVKWPNDFPCTREGNVHVDTTERKLKRPRLGHVDQEESVALTLIEPLWEQVSGSCNEVCKEMQKDTVPLRYFVESENVFDRIYMSSIEQAREKIIDHGAAKPPP